MSNKSLLRVQLLAVFLVGLVLTVLPWQSLCLFANFPRIQKILAEAMPKIGDALMIAPLLAVMIEFAATRELLEEFAKNVSHHIIGHLLPIELRHRLFSYLSANFVRRRWEVEYTLEEIEGIADYVKVTTFTKFEIENRSGITKDYPFNYEIEESRIPEVEPEKICHISAVVDGRQVVHLDENSVKAHLTKKNHSVHFSQSVPLPAHGNTPNIFTMQSIELLPKSYDAPFITLQPALETTLRITHPGNYGLSFWVSFAEEEGFVESKLANGTQYTVVEPMLPGHGFFAGWSKNNEG